MQNFTYRNPVRLVFGKGTIAELNKLVPSDTKVLLAYGGGSIKKNGVYDQVKQALKNHQVVEFGGIEANPKYETLMKAVEIVRTENIGFLLAVGGGSVLDGVKFISVAVKYTGEDPWEILTGQGKVGEAIPLGSVLTLPATGSEMNANSVVSRISTNQKLAFGHPAVYPVFSILDPETTYSLPWKQTANGIVDAFAHTLEQYMTYPANAEIQDRYAESIFRILIELGPKLKEDPNNYDLRANMMWTATMALNGLIGVGVPQDWTTHGIGHELTALFGLDHGQTLAIVHPAVMRHQKDRKAGKLLQYAERVWGITEGSDDERIEKAIAKTESFYQSVGVPTRLADYGITEGYLSAADRLENYGVKLGEHGDIGGQEIREILALCAK